MPEHQQVKQSKKTNTIFQKQATPAIHTPFSNPYSIIQRARVNPKSLTHADIMQLQRTIGNQAVGRLLSSIGASSTSQQATVQRQEISEKEETCPSCMQRQEIPEEEPLQGKMIETIQRQEIPEEEEPLQGKMAETIQRQEIPEEEPLQGKMIETIQRQEIPEEEEPLQGKMNGTVQRQEIPEEEEPLQTKRENNTGIPDNLKAGVESLSGIDMSDVRVHYNSDKPVEVGALAYTQGTNIHVSPGQERHLPHEAWHVVQQAQGRVQPTMQTKGMAVNDDAKLENEADVMGSKALSAVSVNMDTGYEFLTIPTNDNLNRPASQMKPVTQMLIRNNGKVGDIVVDKRYKDNQRNHILYEIIEVIGDKKNPSYKLSLKSENINSFYKIIESVKTGQHHYTIRKSKDKKEPQVNSDGYQQLLDDEDTSPAFARRAQTAVSERLDDASTHSGNTIDRTLERSHFSTFDTVANFGLPLLLEKWSVGIKEKLPMSPQRKAEAKVGAAIKVIGDIIGFVPVVGPIVASPFTLAGTFMGQHAEGHTIKAALTKACIVTGASAGTGAIPIYGEAMAFQSLASDVAGLGQSSNAGRMKKVEAVKVLAKIKDELDQLIKEANSAEPPVNLHDDRDFEAIYVEIDHYLTKYLKIIEELENSGKASLLKYSV